MNTLNTYHIRSSLQMRGCQRAKYQGWSTGCRKEFTPPPRLPGAMLKYANEASADSVISARLPRRYVDRQGWFV